MTLAGATGIGAEPTRVINGHEFMPSDVLAGWPPQLARTSAVSSGGSDLADRSWAYGLGVFFTGWDSFSISFEAFVGTINLRYWPR